jgi:hypothetical protein
MIEPSQPSGRDLHISPTGTQSGTHTVSVRFQYCRQPKYAPARAGVSETLYYAFPDIHWQKIRTNNCLYLSDYTTIGTWKGSGDRSMLKPTFREALGGIRL